MVQSRDTSPGQTELDSPPVSHQWWRVVAVVIGWSLWAQLFWSPLSTEWHSETTGLWFVIAYLLPGAIVALAGVLDRAALSLFAVPASLVPGLVLLPERDLAPLQQPLEMAALGTTVLLYIVAASLRHSDIEGLTQALERDRQRQRLEGTYREYIAIRALFLAGLFVVMTWASMLDPDIASAIAEHHESGEVSARLFIAVTSFFVWCIVAYTMFLVPISNLEYDIRSLQRQIRSWSQSASGLYGRLALWVGLGMLGAGGFVALGLSSGS